MRDFPLANVSPFPASPDANGHKAIHISALVEGFVLQILGDGASNTAKLKSILSDVAPDLGAELRTMSPQQWFWVGYCNLSEARIAEVTSKLPAGYALSDQTHGHVRLMISGAHVRDVLAKGTMVDLSSDAFSIGQSAMTQIGHIGAMITRTEDDCFEITVLRSFAVSLWHELHQMAAEYNDS